MKSNIRPTTAAPGVSRGNDQNYTNYCIEFYDMLVWDVIRIHTGITLGLHALGITDSKIII